MFTNWSGEIRAYRSGTVLPLQPMSRQITVSYPDSLATSLNLSVSDFEKEMRVTSVVKLYELGRIPSGVAARALGLSRVGFLDLLARYEVPVMVFGSTDELDEDIANA